MANPRCWLRFHLDGWRELRRCWHRNAQPAHDYITGLEAARERAGQRAFDSRDRDRRSRRQRDEWIRLFNRLEASVTHHRKGKLYGIDTSDEIDEALWTARDKVLKAAHSRDLDSLGQIGNEPDDAMQVSIDHRPADRPDDGEEQP